MDEIEEENKNELDVAKAKEFAYWEDQLMKCASGEKTEHDPKTIYSVMHVKFGWELPDGYEGPHYERA